MATAKSRGEPFSSNYRSYANTNCNLPINNNNNNGNKVNGKVVPQITKQKDEFQFLHRSQEMVSKYENG